MDGSEPTAVSSNCKILVTLDSGLWLMELIWRLPSLGPPLSSDGREEKEQQTRGEEEGRERGKGDRGWGGGEDKQGNTRLM